MKNISLKLDEPIFNETEKIVNKLKKTRNRYINEALEFYNKFQKRLLLEKKLEKESKLVKNNSLQVLKAFENIAYED